MGQCRTGARPHSSDDDDELTLANASDRLRSWEWPVPDEMVIFASNGQDGSFGVWVPRDGGARPIVVEIGEIFEDACLAVVGDDLESFVRAWVRTTSRAAQVSEIARSPAS